MKLLDYDFINMIIFTLAHLLRRWWKYRFMCGAFWVYLGPGLLIEWSQIKIRFCEVGSAIPILRESTISDTCLFQISKVLTSPNMVRVACECINILAGTWRELPCQFIIQLQYTICEHSCYCNIKQQYLFHIWVLNKFDISP